MSRFRQAISEGDGISVIPVLSGDVDALAAAAEVAGAEAIALDSIAEVAAARGRVVLPVLLRGALVDAGELERARSAGADACVIRLSDLAADDTRLEDLVARAHDL